MRKLLQTWVTVALVAAMGVPVVSTFAGEGGYALTDGNGRECSLGATGIRATTVESKNCFIVMGVDVDSPSYGVVLPYDIITDVNGTPLSGKDIRVPFGYAILDSQAKDGLLRLQVLRGGTPLEVGVRLEKTPDFSPTWPFDCARSRIMVDRACASLAREQLPDGQVPADDGRIGGTQAGLLFLATGDPEYLENGRRAVYWFSDWVQDTCSRNEGFYFGPWPLGYGGIAMAEYYMLTGDRNILPSLELCAKVMADGQMPSGSWSHGFYDGNGAGYGEVNLAGIGCYLTLILAKECGVKVDEAKLRKADRFYERFAPTLSSAYGDFLPSKEGYNAQNGKVGSLAVAHFLNGKEEDSSGYALKSARSCSSILTGHTGHFFNMQWTPVGASFAPAKEYRRCMDQIGWYYAMSQTWRGGLYCQPGGSGRGGDKYSDGGVNMTTAGIGLALAVPRRMLRILGAPKSPFVQELPPELEAAKTLHFDHKWTEAIAAVDEYLKKDGLAATDVQMAHALRDRIRYVKTEFEITTAKLDQMTKKGRLEMPVKKIEGTVQALMKTMGTDHPRLIAILEKLPSRDKKLWQRADDYYESIKKLKEIEREVWFLHSKMVRRAFPTLAAPFEEPDWVSIASMTDKPGSWRILALKDAAGIPAGWQAADFDDKSWTTPSAFKPRETSPWLGKVSREDLQHQLIRVAFDLKDASAKQLMVSLHYGDCSYLLSGSEIYLNGELVLTLLDDSTGGGFTLLRSAPALLREGRNVMAISTPSVGGYPRVALLADLPRPESTFRWTDVAGRDVEIRKLTATRTDLRNYYSEDEDNRSADELMAVFQAQPSFMPEIDYALDRYTQVAPPVATQQKQIATLLKSPVWGARYAGLKLLTEAPEPMLEGFMGQVIDMFKDPHAYVRKTATGVVGRYGDSAKAAIPTLVKITENYEGETWWTRQGAFSALQKMTLDEKTKQRVIRAGLADPDAGSRRSALDASVFSEDKDVFAAAIKDYQKELIDQVFTVPHGMFTRGGRAKVAKIVADNFTKDELRPYLPKFLGALSLSGGSTLQGSQTIIAFFGQENVEKLKTLLEDKNDNVQFNALQTLCMIAQQKDAPTALLEFVRPRLQVLATQEDSPRTNWAKKELGDIETRMAKIAN